MNKWLIRILGLIILVLIGVFFIDSWLNPRVPQQLQESVAGQKTPPTSAPAPTPATNTQTPAENNQQADNNTIQLMSLDGGQPVLSNPQAPQSAATPAPAPAPQQTAPQPQAAQPVAQQAAPAPQKPTAQPAQKSSGVWLQAGAFSSRSNAQNRANALHAQHLATDIESVNVNGKEYNRVYVGPLSQSQVSGAMQALKKMGIDARPISR